MGFVHIFWPLSLATKRCCKATYKRALRQPEENERFYFFKSCYLLTIKSISVGVGRREKFISLRCHAVKKFLRVMPVFWSCRLTSLTTLVKNLYPKTFPQFLWISFLSTLRGWIRIFRTSGLGDLTTPKPVPHQKFTSVVNEVEKIKSLVLFGLAKSALIRCFATSLRRKRQRSENVNESERVESKFYEGIW